MSWAQLTNRPNNNVSHQYTPNHNNTYYRKPNNNNNRITINNNTSQPLVPTISSKNKHTEINYVILDSGAFIGRQSFFNNFSPNVAYYMTPAVNHEIRDKQSRHFLDNFPYQIIVKKPDPQSVQFVSKFLSKNPTLRSLSKVDRQIIALAHTLELEKEGNKNIKLFDLQKNKNNNKKQINSINNRNNKNQLKKSKTGRVHTQAEPISDTGLRLAKLKKIIPFHFDDFMTMSKQKYGEKYGKPTPIEITPNSPKFKTKLSLQKVEKLSEIDNKSESQNEIEYNPNIKAKTEINDATMSKSQRRRLRKKLARTGNKDITENNLLEFGMIKDDSDSDNENNNKNNSEKKLVLKPSKTAGHINKNNNSNSNSNSNSNKETHDIDAMIEEDLNNTFNETASLISSLSAQSAQHKKQINDINKRLNLIQGNNKPGLKQSQSQPQPINSGFGTMFNGEKGSIFGGKNGSSNENGLPALPQSKAVEIEEKKTVNDAWNGEWLSAENYKKVGNKKNQKKKLKNVQGGENKYSSVAVITVDKAMQKCMVDMGLRVLTTSKDRQYGGGGSGYNNNNNNNNTNNNGEPINYIFRCYGCFQYENNTNRTHCRWCGGQTYQRVAIYEDNNGKPHYRYYYRDRYGHKYLNKHSLVPRGSQLVKNNQMNSNNNHMNMNNQKRKKKKRGYLGNNNNYRGHGNQNRW